jgi:hypothetical protein
LTDTPSVAFPFFFFFFFFFFSHCYDRQLDDSLPDINSKSASLSEL